MHSLREQHGVLSGHRLLVSQVACADTEATDAKAAKTIDDRTIMYSVDYLEVTSELS